MKKMLIILGLALVSICMGQYLETVIPLADSLSTWYVYYLAYNPGSNTVWVGECSTLVFDASTGDRLMLIPRGFQADCYNPVSDKFYAASDSLYVYDGATNTRLAALDFVVDETDGKERFMVHDPGGNKLYATLSRGDTIAVVCGFGDTLIGKVHVDQGAGILEYNAVSRKVYSLNRHADTLTVIDASADTVTARRSVRCLSWQPMAWSSQSNKLFVGTETGVDVFDGETDSLLKHIPHRGFVEWLKYNPVNNHVYGVSSTAYVLSIDCETDSIVAEVQPPNREAYSLYCSPDANKVYVADWEHHVLVIDCAADTIVAIGRTGAQDSDVPFCHSPVDNRVFMACEDGGSVAVIGGVTDSVETVVVSNRFDPHDPCYVEARDRVYIPDYSIGGLSVIDCATNTLLSTKVIGLRPLGAVADTLGRKLYLLDGRDTRQISVVSLETDSLAGVVKATAILNGPMALNPRTGKLYCNASHEGSKLAVVDTEGDSVLTLIEVLGWHHDFAISPVSNQVYAFNDWDSLVAVVDGSGDTVIGFILLGEPPLCLGYSRSLDRVYAIGFSGLLSVIDCRTNSVVAETNVRTPGSNQSPLWNPVSNKLYYRTIDDSLCMVDCRTGEVAANLGFGQYPVPRFCDTLANKVYVTDRSGTVWFLDGETDSIVGSLEGLEQPGDMAWCPSRRRVYVCNASSSVAVLKDTVVTGIATERPYGYRAGAPTVLRRTLPLSGRQDAVLLDIAGRRVMDLKPGENDIRHVAPGVYFVRTAVSGERSAVSGKRSAVRKVVIQR
ncbi:MAG: hypothetical protein JSU73_10190 [candidate division WOR-3 bacterium]|nr:MAG: hypothetical protein JSU73_10190 [candidate division WOR-3 bacterium]